MIKLLKLIAIFMLMGIVMNVNGQSLKDRLKRTVNKAADKAEEEILNPGNEKDEAPDNQDNNSDQAEPENNQQNDQQTSPGKEQTQLQSYSKFDFMPGEKVIFYDDFSQDAVGDFPALWNTNSGAEVVTTNLFPGNWMKFSTDEAIWTDQLLDLPDNYTIEFDVIPIAGEEGGMKGYGFRLMEAINAKAFDWGAVPGKAGFFLDVAYFGTPYYRTYINTDEGADLGLSGNVDGEKFKQKLNQKYRISVWVQKARIRLYQDENKLVDLPKAFNASDIKMDRIRFENGAAMIGNIRIAVGAPDTRSKLITEGKLVSYGIYFDVNKDVVKPESYATLKEIAAALNENPDVRVKITGHTDSDGADEANLDLSRRRAESVKNELGKTFGIDLSRLETEGMGETAPIAPNDSPVNKALNRRVEFLKL
jgi:OmpA-OmpF porin, OOP family